MKQLLSEYSGGTGRALPCNTGVPVTAPDRQDWFCVLFVYHSDSDGLPEVYLSDVFVVRGSDEEIGLRHVQRKDC